MVQGQVYYTHVGNVYNTKRIVKDYKEKKLASTITIYRQVYDQVLWLYTKSNNVWNRNTKHMNILKPWGYKNIIYLQNYELAMTSTIITKLMVHA